MSDGLALVRDQLHLVAAGELALSSLLADAHDSSSTVPMSAATLLSRPCDEKNVSPSYPHNFFLPFLPFGSVVLEVFVVLLLSLLFE